MPAVLALPNICYQTAAIPPHDIMQTSSSSVLPRYQYPSAPSAALHSTSRRAVVSASGGQHGTMMSAGAGPAAGGSSCLQHAVPAPPTPTYRAGFQLQSTATDNGASKASLPSLSTPPSQHRPRLESYASTAVPSHVSDAVPHMQRGQQQPPYVVVEVVHWKLQADQEGVPRCHGIRPSYCPRYFPGMAICLV